MRTRASCSQHSSGAGCRVTARFLRAAACERFSSSIFQDSSRDSGSPAARWWRRRGDPGRPERLQGKAKRPGALGKGTGKPVLGRREWARPTEAAEKLKRKDRSTGEVAGEEEKEIRRLSRREDQPPILRVPRVDFCFRIFHVCGW